MSYNSATDTWKHRERVSDIMFRVLDKLDLRRTTHDWSKLNSPEKEIFDEYTPKLKGSTYGSDEYKGFLAAMKPALDHHYQKNRHHPEHFSNGVNGMTLIDLVEMLCDWKAASERHADGDIVKSIDINRERFGLDAQLYQILMNTAKELFDEQADKVP